MDALYPPHDEPTLSTQSRNNVQVMGQGSQTVVFAHGFGCDQTMWRLLAPLFAQTHRVILFDLVGSGGSDLASYESEKYATLDGYASDLVEVMREFSGGTPAIFVGHSVSAMIGVLADIRAPDLFHAHLMISPSPCYIDDGDYRGGFTRADIESLLTTLDSNYLGWSSTMAPVIMGAPGQPELGEELTNSFCRTDPDIAQRFARTTFLSDHRAHLPKVQTPTLIVQCHDDLIAPVEVGEFMARTLPRSTLRIIENVGHCPHLSAPDACTKVMIEFIDSLETTTSLAGG
jgi:sigma-B regulation protein RsbQ